MNGWPDSLVLGFRTCDPKHGTGAYWCLKLKEFKKMTEAGGSLRYPPAFYSPPLK